LNLGNSFTFEDGNDQNKSNLDKTNIDGMVASIVENSELLEEKIYSSYSKETWMTKSFNVTPVKNRRESAFHVKLKSKASTKASAKTVIQTASRTQSIENYKNNTFISHIQAANGIDLSHTPSDTIELFAAISKYKTITNLIEKHLKSEESIFNQIITKFEEIFVPKYEKILDKVKSGDMRHTEVDPTVEQAITDVQQFIRILYETLNQYYRLERLRIGILPNKDHLFNRDNIINFITCILFNGTKIYDTLFNLIKIQERDVEEQYQKNIALCKFKNPQDFGVPDQYCLNERTIDYLQRKGNLNRKISYDEDGPSVCFTILESVDESQDELKTKKITGKPYSKAITTLSYLSERKSPIHKLKTIVKTAELISSSIEEFYRELNQTNTKKLDGDQTLSIFMYIVAKSGLKDISAHCKIIEKFSTNNILNSVSGYYATTLEACLNCLTAMNFKEEMTPEQLTASIKELIFSFSPPTDSMEPKSSEVNEKGVQSLSIENHKHMLEMTNGRQSYK